jgi:signal transduction histidine kinase
MISVRAGCDHDVRGEADEVTIAVHSQGPAIPDELVGRIFQPMKRGRSDAGDRGHLGLGLSIVDRIVAAHRGGST